jgi:hypothetical protein
LDAALSLACSLADAIMMRTSEDLNVPDTDFPLESLASFDAI